MIEVTSLRVPERHAGLARRVWEVWGTSSGTSASKCARFGSTNVAQISFRYRAASA